MILLRIQTAIALLCALSLTTADARSAPHDLIILGWVETVYLPDPGLEHRQEVPTIRKALGAVCAYRSRDRRGIHHGAGAGTHDQRDSA